MSRLARFAYDNHNLIFVVIALVTTVTMAVISGHWLFYRASYILAALIPVCYVWARWNLRGITVRVERGNDRVQVGQLLETTIRVKSHTTVTKIWLELEDQTDMPGATTRTVITVPSRGTRNWKTTTRCARRGVFTTGPIRVTTGDAFGLFRLSQDYGEATPLIVLPQPQELPYFWAPAAQLPGEGSVHKRTHYVTPNAASIREYHPGDSYNRIHWRTTARTGRLMVKTFEMDPTSNIWIVVDLDSAVQAGEGDESTEEYGVRIATSIAYHFLNGNRMVGLLASGAEKVVLDPSRGAMQYGRVLETMAIAKAGEKETLSQVLQEEGRRFGRHTTLIVVTSSTDPEWVVSLHDIVRSGTRAVAVVLEPGTFDPSLDNQPPLSELAATGTVTYVVRAGGDLSLMLGPAGIVGSGSDRPRVAVR